MKLFLYSALAATLCAAPTMAQPQDGAQIFADQTDKQTKLQIKKNLQDLIATLNQSGANMTASTYIYGAREGYFGANEWAPHFKNWYSGEIQLKDVEVLEHKGNDAKATISYAFVTIPNDEASKARMANQQETLNFKLIQLPLDPLGLSWRKVWQIVPPEVEPPTIGAENNDVLWANISYYLAQKESPKPNGKPVERSMNNLKQLGLGTNQFVQDYFGVYAFDPLYFSEALSPYIGSNMIFRVPNTNEIYTFNGNISGLNFEQLKSATKTVLFYEGQNEKPTFRYDGKAAICFADGHVALVTPDEAQKLIWKP